MTDALRVLHLSDSDRETEWLQSTLSEGGYTTACRRVDNVSQYRPALAEGAWDLVVCDPRTPRLRAVSEALCERDIGDGPPAILIVDAFDPHAELAHRLGAAMCLRERGLAHLAPAVARALAEGAWRAQRRQDAAFEQGHRDVLERVAAGADLGCVLEQIVRLVEQQAAGMLCSILLLDAEQGRMRHGAAPSLPEEFRRAVDGAPIGPKAGSCGTAAYRRERVVVEDIGTHPYWEDYRQLALPLGLRACWSNPIFAAEGGDVLGTFAMYYREARGPRPRERAWVERATHLTAVAISHDRAARAVRRSEARYRQLLETSYEGVWLLDAGACALFVNARAAEMLGYATPEILGRGLLEFMDEASQLRAKGSFLERLRTVGTQQEFRFRREDGTFVWALVAGSPIQDERGEVVGALAMMTDIDALKSVEEALRQSEAESRAVFEKAAIGMALVGSDGRLVRANPALQRFLGCGEADLRKRTLADFVHPDDARDAPDDERALPRGERDSYESERRYLRPDGTLVWGRLSASAASDAGAPRSAIIMVENVTERRAMEEAMRASERLRTLMYDAVSDVVFYLGVEPEGRFRFLSINPAFLRSTGLDEGRVLGRLVEEVFPEPARTAVIEHYRRAIRERARVTWEEVSVYPAGTRYGEVAVTPIFAEDGTCTNLVGTVHDVTENRVAQEQLKAQATLLDKAKDAILVRDLAGRIHFWNRGAERLYGWSRDEAIGRDVRALLYRDSSAFERAQRHLLEAGEWTGEIVQSTRSGTTVTVEGSWTLLRDDQGQARAVLAINTDITEKRRLEAQVIRTQRMESLGTLAGGIAHDFNNILTAIVGNITLAMDEVPADHAVQERLVEVEKASARATELVRRILTFSRQGESRRRVIELEPVVTEALRLLRATTPAKIRIDSRFAPDVPRLFADPTQIHQVVVNLGTNAAHAIGREEGTLGLAAERVAVPAGGLPGAPELPAGDYARISVTDTGSGMDEATLEHIFEPFFTTKGPGAGTGLGLSVVHGIVRSHEGAITVVSTPGRGTTFSIYLPAAPDAAAEPAARGSELSRGHGEHVLCLNDEETVVEVLVRLLERLGYRATGFSDPARAVAALTTTGADYRALLTDLSMPGPSGLDIARTVRGIIPGFPVILVSGHIGREDLQAARDVGIDELMLKPCAADELAAALHRALDRRK